MVKNKDVREHLWQIRREFGTLTMVIALLYVWQKKKYTFLDAIHDAKKIEEWEHRAVEKIKNKFITIKRGKNNEL